eukprot:CAMPEP_0170407152 /NCGR_PEP_ID=MMETSP0117_2-20130122/28095_1 /TAXON_ID=400756 /ORGANISM="Durinskia baltica, Strain CSIRO CS-38" /LENGTH=92 /DNA_ID=CAMNT_0010664381 /DNA_START=196 /DNA_END=470 /DNA_ORIENTATION=-
MTPTIKFAPRGSVCMNNWVPTFSQREGSRAAARSDAPELWRHASTLRRWIANGSCVGVGLELLGPVSSFSKFSRCWTRSPDLTRDLADLCAA